MTVAVGYLAGKCGHAPLNLAVEVARMLQSPLVVVTVVPKPWTTPSQARVDAEYAAYAAKLGAQSEEEARGYFAAKAPDLDISYRQVTSRTAGDGLLDAVEEVGVEVLVVGSSSDGALGQVVLGSTTDWLLHASPVPVAISPRGYRGSRSGAVSRVTFAHSGTPESVRAVGRMARLCSRCHVAMRVVSFAIRGRTMYPPEVGLHAEDTLLAALAGDLEQMLAGLKAGGVVPADVATQVVTGNGWGEALDSTEWQDGELLAVGTTSRLSIKSVFLGSRGAKIIRYSPVPVLVLPG